MQANRLWKGEQVGGLRRGCCLGAVSRPTAISVVAERRVGGACRTRQRVRSHEQLAAAGARNAAAARA